MRSIAGLAKGNTCRTSGHYSPLKLATIALRNASGRSLSRLNDYLLGRLLARPLVTYTAIGARDPQGLDIRSATSCLASTRSHNSHLAPFGTTSAA